MILDQLLESSAVGIPPPSAEGGLPAGEGGATGEEGEVPLAVGDLTQGAGGGLASSPRPSVFSSGAEVCG